MNAAKLTLIASFVFTLGCAVALIPGNASAETSSHLGGGNALLRGTTGVANANVASHILSRMEFAAARGGQPEETPPGDEESGEEEDTDTSADTNAVNQNANQNASDHSNGGQSAGNGGNGGDAGPGGLIRAGDVVSNTTAVNAINTVIVRIGR